MSSLTFVRWTDQFCKTKTSPCKKGKYYAKTEKAHRSHYRVEYPCGADHNCCRHSRRFGGFGTGYCADTKEFSKYATSVSELTVPDEAQIVALGEATHGNKEFQKLRLDVFQALVEKYGVRAFALEGDFGGCEEINRYIHGADGTAAEALSATGFVIYRTEEMENLVEWMRDYNASAAQGDDLRFYGFDMEQCAYSYRYLLEAVHKSNIDATEFEKMWNSETKNYAEGYTTEQRTEIIRAVKEQLPPDDAQAIHYADILFQNMELWKYINDYGALNAQRDRMMVENTLWILQQEQARGNSRILISGHNNHIMQCENAGTPVLGSLLAEELGAAILPSARISTSPPAIFRSPIPASGSPTPFTPITRLPKHRKNAALMSISWIFPKCREALHLLSILLIAFRWVHWVNPTAF